MEIRVLREEELMQASGLSRYVFDTCLRNRMEFTQTIPFVENYISETNLLEMVRDEKLVVWGAYEQEQLVGVSGIQSDGMITLLYVLPQYTRRGCGMQLLTTMRVYAQTVLHLDKVIVNATPAWTSGYFYKRGFSTIQSNPNMRVPFLPMHSSLNTMVFHQKEKISVKTIVGAIFACVGFATVVSAWFMISYLLG